MWAQTLQSFKTPLTGRSLGLRRRFIEDRDLPALASLLAAGFPLRTKGEWERGLNVLRARRVPRTFPRYGLLLEEDDRPVGVLLMVFSEVDGQARCNLSSWYVEPAFRPYAPLLLNAALSDRTVTYLNLTPAPHTQHIIEAQGFRSFCRGSILYLPGLRKQRERVRVVAFDERHAGVPEADLLAAHVALGSLCVVVEADDGPHPFVFAPPKRLRRLLPGTHLLYCRDLDTFGRFAGALGRWLLRRGSVVVLVTADQALPGLIGRRFNKAQNKYVFGPHPPRPGDLAYTEYAIFGG